MILEQIKAHLSEIRTHESIAACATAAAAQLRRAADALTAVLTPEEKEKLEAQTKAAAPRAR